MAPVSFLLPRAQDAALGLSILEDQGTQATARQLQSQGGLLGGVVFCLVLVVVMMTGFFWREVRMKTPWAKLVHAAVATIFYLAFTSFLLWPVVGLRSITPAVYTTSPSVVETATGIRRRWQLSEILYHLSSAYTRWSLALLILGALRRLTTFRHWMHMVLVIVIPVLSTLLALLGVIASQTQCGAAFEACLVSSRSGPAIATVIVEVGSALLDYVVAATSVGVLIAPENADKRMFMAVALAVGIAASVLPIVHVRLILENFGNAVSLSKIVRELGDREIIAVYRLACLTLGMVLIAFFCLGPFCEACAIKIKSSVSQIRCSKQDAEPKKKRVGSCPPRPIRTDIVAEEAVEMNGMPLAVRPPKSAVSSVAPTSESQAGTRLMMALSAGTTTAVGDEISEACYKNTEGRSLASERSEDTVRPPARSDSPTHPGYGSNSDGSPPSPKPSRSVSPEREMGPDTSKIRHQEDHRTRATSLSSTLSHPSATAEPLRLPLARNNQDEVEDETDWPCPLLHPLPEQRFRSPRSRRDAFHPLTSIYSARSDRSDGSAFALETKSTRAVQSDRSMDAPLWLGPPVGQLKKVDRESGEEAVMSTKSLSIDSYYRLLPDHDGSGGKRESRVSVSGVAKDDAGKALSMRNSHQNLSEPVSDEKRVDTAQPGAASKTFVEEHEEDDDDDDDDEDDDESGLNLWSLEDLVNRQSDTVNASSRLATAPAASQAHLTLLAPSLMTPPETRPSDGYSTRPSTSSSRTPLYSPFPPSANMTPPSTPATPITPSSRHSQHSFNFSRPHHSRSYSYSASQSPKLHHASPRLPTIPDESRHSNTGTKKRVNAALPDTSEGNVRVVEVLEPGSRGTEVLDEWDAAARNMF